jgi:hypothetical protein
MRARSINEIQNFERGNDPKSSMSIGKITKIQEMLEVKQEGIQQIFG